MLIINSLPSRLVITLASSSCHSLSLPRSSLINDGLAANLRGDDSSLITSDFITAADGAVYTPEVRAFGGIGDWLVCPRCERFCYVRFVYGSMFLDG